MPFFTHPTLLLLAVPVWFAWRRFGGARGSRSAIRLCLLAVLLLIVAGPVCDAPERGSTVVLVIDRSRSMPVTTKQFESHLRQQAAAEQREADQLAVVGFGARAVVEQSPGRPPLTNLPDVDKDESNLHAAVAAALDLVPVGQRGRLLVLSDGLADDSLTESLAAQLRRRGVRVDYLQFPLNAPHETTDVELRSVRGPTQVELGAVIAFDLEIVASDATQRTLQVSRDGALLSAKPLDLTEGPNQLTWSERLDRTGVFKYSFQVDVPGDPSPGNNTWDTWVEVRGKPAVLVLNATGDETPLVEMLRRSGVAVDTIQADKADLSLEKLSGFRACVLENVPAPESGSTNAKVLLRFVEQLGGGLIITGGDRSFGAGGYRFSPLEPLLPVTLRSLSVSERPAQALVVLVEPNAWEAAVYDPDLKVTPLQQALLTLAQELDPADRMGVVTPRNPDPVALPLSTVTRKKDLRDAVMQLGLSNDPSAFPKALTAAWDMLSRAPQLGKHLVLLISTDQLAAWPPRAIDPLVSNPISGATVSVVTWGKPDVTPRMMWPNQWTGLRVFSTNDTAQLAPILRNDWELTTGSSFIGRPTAVEISTTLPAAEASLIPKSLPTIPGFHTATLRDRATASLVAKDAPGQPLLARRSHGPGRVCTALFPFESPPNDTPEWDNLASVLVEQIRWVGRIQDTTPQVPVHVERADRTVTVRLPVRLSDSSVAQRNGPFELHITALDGKPVEKPAIFRRVESEHVAEFRLNRTGTYFVVVQRDGDLIARCPPIALPRSTEFLRSATPADGRAVLNRLAQASGGGEYTRGTPMFDEPIRAHRSLVPVFACLAALLLVLDVADRSYRFTEQLDLRVRQLAARRRQRMAAEDQAPQPASDPFEKAKEKLRQRLKR